ncbi:hypothetical protein COV13_00975 [Candidatus Woesearchaeota archaeon CG10_big_fil_rev_8_21_14_0_10_32_9]|nr:MAG: hypothetical protein COV13_00975 [Candidatus Woesearchaeota archaeon CG10_big_fil_rev_8_21_14_0_10_32_9]
MKRIISKLSLVPAFLLAVMVGLPSVLAAFPGPSEGIGGMLNSVFLMISQLFTLSFLDSAEAKLGFFRFLLWILVFSLLYFAGRIVFARFNQGNAVPGTIAAVLATTTMILTPQSVILAVFQTYGIVILTVIMMAAIIGLLYLVYGVMNNINPPWLLHMLRLVIIIICWWITAEVLNWGPEFMNQSLVLVSFISLNNKNSKTTK